MATKKTATKKTATKKKVAKSAPVTADVEVAPAYTAWVPADMPVGGKSNSTEQLNDHPTEHNHTASAVSDIVDRFADLRLYVPGVNSCGIAGDLQVDGDLEVHSQNRSVRIFDSGVNNYAELGFTTRASNGPANGYLSGNVVVIRTGGSRETMQDVFVALSDGNVKAYGDLQVDGQTKAQNGTKAAPAYSFTSDPKTGMYLYSKGIASIVCDGKNVANFGTAGIAFPEGLATITGTPANLHIGSDGQLRRITDVKTPTTADIDRLETVIEKLSARIEELEARLTPATADS